MENLESYKEYYEQAHNYRTANLFEEWLTTLREPMLTHFKQNGYEQEKGALPFLRFVNESRGIGLEQFLKSKRGYKTEDE